MLFWNSRTYSGRHQLRWQGDTLSVASLLTYDPLVTDTTTRCQVLCKYTGEIGGDGGDGADYTATIKAHRMLLA